MAGIRIADFGNRVAPPTSGSRVPADGWVGKHAGLAQGTQKLAETLLADERKQSEVVAREASRADALLAGAHVQNGLTELEDQIKEGLATGTIQKDQALSRWESEGRKLLDKTLKDVAPEHAAAMRAHGEGALGRMAINVQRAVTQRQQQDVSAGLMQYGELMERYAMSNRPQATRQFNQTLDVMGPLAGLTPQQIQDTRQRFVERSGATYWGKQLLDNANNPTSLARIRTEIEADEAIDPGQRNVLVERAGAMHQSSLAGAASDLEIGVRRGALAHRDVEAAFRSGVISGPKRTELTVFIDSERKRIAEKAAKEREALGRVDAALTASGFLDFRSEKDRSAVDLYYDRVLAPSMTRQKLNPEQTMTAVADFAANTGILPGPVRQTIRGALRAGDPVAKVQAADFLDRVKRVNPQVLNDFADQDIALGNTIQSYIKAGVAPLQAVALAEAAMNVPDAERKARDTRYTAEKAPEKNRKRLGTELTGFRFIGPSMPGKVPDALAGEFEVLTRENFTRTGDLEAAQATALDHLRKVWGVTRTGSKPTWMKYAPETVYGAPGDDGAWIREQLHAEVTRNSLFDGKPDLSLAADSITAREDRPSYVVLNRRNGVLEPLLGPDGRPLRFRPDFATSPAGKLERENAEKERKAAEKALRTPRRTGAPQLAEEPAE